MNIHQHATQAKYENNMEFASTSGFFLNTHSESWDRNNLVQGHTVLFLRLKASKNGRKS
jgi:hypothetical protein